MLRTLLNGNLVTGLVLLGEDRPGIGLELLQAEADAGWPSRSSTSRTWHSMFLADLEELLLGCLTFFHDDLADVDEGP